MFGNVVGRVGAMSVTRLTIGFGVIVVIGLSVLAALGSKPAIEMLVTVVALVVLVGGGNWINGRDQPHRDQPHRDQPHRDQPHRDQPHRDQPHRDQPHRSSPTPPSSTFDPSDEEEPDVSEVQSQAAPGFEHGRSEGR